MTQAEFASHRQVGRSAVSNWKAQGLLVFGEGPGGRPMVDVERTDARINSAKDPARGRPTNAEIAGRPAARLSPEPDAPSAARDNLGVVRTDLLREQHLGHKLRNARDAGELVAVADFEARIAELGRLSRERVHSVVRAQAERLAAEHDPRVITALLTAEIDRAFHELADQAEAGALAAVEDEMIPEEQLEEA